jgi:hypothetical protein
MSLSVSALHYAFLDQVDINQTFQLMQYHPLLRLTQLTDSAATASAPTIDILLDRVLILKFVLTPQRSLSPQDSLLAFYDLNQKVYTLAFHFLEVRQNYYRNVNFYEVSHFLEKPFPLSSIECEFLISNNLLSWITALNYTVFSPQDKLSVLKAVNSPNNPLAQFQSVDNYSYPPLISLRELCRTYSLQAKIAKVIAALDSLSLPSDQFAYTEIYEGFENLSRESIYDEFDFRMRFFQAARMLLLSQTLPEGSLGLEVSFQKLYLNFVKSRLWLTLQKHPSQVDAFTHISDPFWHETQIDKAWWDCIVHATQIVFTSDLNEF